MSGFVYFLRLTDRPGPVKIGYSQDLRKRVSELRCGCPFPLELVATIAGPPELERRIHNALRESWSHGEWFAQSPRVLDLMRGAEEGTLSLDDLPGPRRVFTPRKHGWRPEQRYSASLRRRVHFAGRRVHVPEAIHAAAARYAGNFNAAPYDVDDGLTVARFLATVGYDFRAPPICGEAA